MSDKLNVGFVSSSLLIKTGFSNNLRAILPYLYKTNKFNLFHLNQGIGESPDFQRFPWVNWSVFKDGTIDMNKFQTDEGYKRFCSYGNAVIEKFILDNKLDVVIHIEDIWSSQQQTYIQSRWYPRLKENFLQWTTADSLPILPDFKVWAENCPNMWFWASFAEKALKEEDIKKYGHVKTIPGCFDTREYHPILKHEKKELRKKNNIDEDTMIFFQLGRSQLRKLYPFTIESFSKFKKRNPKIKSKLLFHCSAAEGWPFERLFQEWKLDKADVLFTYFCINCGAWEVKPLDGEFKDCKFCGVKGCSPNQHNHRGAGQKTAGVDSNISNEEMSKIFGICDASISAFTSGGYERFNAESLLCELPLLCSDYSCGKDFTCNDFVFPLDGNFTYEVGTGFLKHVPNINTMVKFYEKICSIPEEKRKEIGKRGSNWAKEHFDISVIGKKLEDWLDSRKKIEWNFKYEESPKNPNAQIQDIPDDIEFVKACYKEILTCPDVEKSDNGGYNHWINFLKQPGDKSKLRNDMIGCFRSAALQHNRQNNPTPFDMELIKNDKKHLLIVLQQSIGDVILSTSLLPSFRKNYPKESWNIYYATSPQYREILDANPNIDKILDFQPFFESEIACIGQGKTKGYFDAYAHLANSQQHKLNYLSNSNICVSH